ncbi:hypothetical protein BH10PSE4_BH10PSE4_28460 [soil metagenome]
MTGKLAASPPCPPFPAFTALELRALDCLAPMFGDDEAEFRRQVSAGEVVDRINTIVGFYTRVVVDRSLCRPLPIRFKGGHFEVGGIEHGMGVVLWDDDGYLETVKGFTYDDDPLLGRDLAELQFVAMAQLG